MEHVGKTFLFDYGGFAVRVQYLSSERLAWEQLEGPSVGSRGEESYRLVPIRPRVYFISWQEQDTSVVSQVVDFERGLVHTTWISPQKQVEHFEGTVRAAGPTP